MSELYYRLYTGNCLDVLQGMEADSVDSVVCDPPYGLEFMGKKWDYDVPSVAIWKECLRVLKPGGHLLSFAGTRTQHRMCVNIEDAGFEIRDMIAWVYGSGMPKGMDVSKAIDKAAGAEREVIGTRKLSASTSSNFRDDNWEPDLTKLSQVTAPATDAAKQWSGWNTSLKPSFEPVTLARKPLIGTVAQNVQRYGTGAINVERCRIGEPFVSAGGSNFTAWRAGEERDDLPNSHQNKEPVEANGRWPANLIHDGSDEATEPLGNAARFFYCAKASKKDRNEGCEELPSVVAGGMKGRADGSLGSVTYNNNNHPTVKPTELMRYLCRLVTRSGGVVLDPFAGSGSTGKAALLEGFSFIGIEREPDYVVIADRRIRAVADSVGAVSKTVI